MPNNSFAKKESSLHSLFSPLKSSPGVKMAQSSCLFLLNSVSIKPLTVPIHTPAATIAAKVSGWCWLSGKNKQTRNFALGQNLMIGTQALYPLEALYLPCLFTAILPAFLLINRHFVVESRKNSVSPSLNKHYSFLFLKICQSPDKKCEECFWPVCHQSKSIQLDQLDTRLLKLLDRSEWCSKMISYIFVSLWQCLSNLFYSSSLVFLETSVNNLKLGPEIWGSKKEWIFG